MPSLVEALEQKYGLANLEIQSHQDESLVSIFVPKLPPRMSVPELLVLNDCNIDKAGESEDLRKKCSSVKELDLAQNKLEKWSEVFGILTNMPRVEFVNLSLNRLAGPVAPPSEFSMTRLRSLVLNNTRLDWENVESLLSLLPMLEELHLSLNDYKQVLIDTIEDDFSGPLEGVQLNDDEDEATEEDEMANQVCTCGAKSKTDPPLAGASRTDSVCSMYRKTSAHEGVRKLHFTGNPVTEWLEICRLGRVFPNLESLVLADCPIKSLESSNTATSAASDDNNCDSPHAHFQSLTFLNLSNSDIQTWNDIDRLALFPKLKNLRVQNWPLWDKCDSTEHERRQLLIARLPQVQTLNGGGVVGAEEREDAERAFIRYYMDKPESDRPERYAELISVHGKLDPLVNIDLRPEKRVKVTFTYGDTSEIRSVDVYRTVFDLKTRLERLAGIPAAKMRLYYVDQELRDLQGPEEMKYPHKQLYSYNIRSGDEIIIDRKH
ncbi:tubulin-specific chaperone cofactor E-like protein [Phlebotomus argentipes]|uniref:tubulin-specific chaperone cofactor E-like protein n=1 Tax=Phlebotomus argentipes TaxID=94469 RepID=UPI002892BDDD|nr:tubulin-specific chaperone cofactor E-like protein [Phlebotomus argentipes]